MNTGTRKHFFLFSLAGLFFIIDRVCKWIAPQTDPFGFRYLGFEYFENTGIAFSLPVPQIIVVLLTPIIVILLLHYMRHTVDPLRWVAWSLICAGALSNFIDRMLFGFVIDYLRIATAVINIADILIIVGVIMMLVRYTPSTNST